MTESGWASYFAATYAEAREGFRRATAAHPHVTEQGALTVTPEHTIDWAFTGDPSASDLLVYTSGLHGIEGYAGSAMQRRLLALGESRPVLWLHALNPWGMASFRRVNENNVDLNRNFFPDDAAYEADDAAYAALDGLLNPKRPPGTDGFLLRAAYHLVRHGMGTLRNAVARGQYSFPEGVFFGGRQREATTRLVLEHLPPKLAGRRRAVLVDLHTARGPRGDYVAFLEKGDGTSAARARPIFGSRLRAWEPGTADGYEMRGGMLPELQRRVAGVRVDAMTVEIGTASDLQIIRALRAENQLTFHGVRSDGHPAMAAMREAFAPSDPTWRRAVVTHAPSIHRQACELLAS